MPSGRSRPTGWTSTIDTNAGAAPVLVVIAAPAIRTVVDDILQNMELTSILTATWRQALTATTDPPSCMIVDLDDVSDKLAGVAVLRRTWGDEVPLIVLSHHPDVLQQAAAVGALAGIRQPMNVGKLMDAIRRAVRQENLR